MVSNLKAPSALFALARIFRTDRDEEVAQSDGARESSQALCLTQGSMSTYRSSQNGSLTWHPSKLPGSAVDQDELSGFTAHFSFCEATLASKRSTAGVELKKRSKAFTLFEVLIALAVFAFSVAGLVMALDSMVKAVLETRERVFSRLSLESRLAYNLVDPPVSGERIFTNHGITFTESLTPVDMTDIRGNELSGMYRLKITSEYEKMKETAEILLYRPQ